MCSVARIFLERRDMSDDIRRILNLLDDGAHVGGAPGECVPPCDVVETAGGVELVIDLPGVTRESLTIVFVRSTLVIAGQKLPAACEHRDAAFHLAERTFGRFARAVRLTGAFDAGAATARLASRRAARQCCPAFRSGAAARSASPSRRTDRCASCSSVTSSESPDARSRAGPSRRSSRNTTSIS